MAYGSEPTGDMLGLSQSAKKSRQTVTSRKLFLSRGTWLRGRNSVTVEEWTSSVSRWNWTTPGDDDGVPRISELVNQ